MKFRPYSYSKISAYQSCPRQFKYSKIDKLPQGPIDMTALIKGGAIHHMLEMYPNESNYKAAPQYKHIVDNFLNTDLGKKYFSVPSTRELDFGLTKELKPCGYNDKEALFRGSVDYICVIDGILHLNDWKSGKVKDIRWQSFDQLNYYSIYFFQKYPTIDKIRISYVYVEHENIENEILLDRKYLNVYKKNLIQNIIDLESDNEFEKNITKLCDWCPYQDYCEKDV